MTAILIGCDPEVFVKQEGSFRSAFGLIPGNKKDPYKVRNGAVQVDGMALEFNINPAKNEDEFVFNVEDVFNQMKLMVPHYQVVTVPVAHFDEEYLNLQPFEALELGCDPDFNGWDMQENCKPRSNKPMRTASGHVHIGWTDGMDSSDNFVPAAQVAKQMDFYLGLGSLLFDSDTERREMYGKAGCFRPKPYGCEYRTLSNAWLKDQRLMRWVYRQAVKGVQALMVGKALADKYGDIQGLINESNIREAKKILYAEKMELPDV